MLSDEPSTAWMPEPEPCGSQRSPLGHRLPARRTALGILAGAVVLGLAAPFFFAELLILAGALIGAAVALWHPGTAADLRLPLIGARPVPLPSPRPVAPRPARRTAAELRKSEPRPALRPPAEPRQEAPGGTETPRSKESGPKTVLVVDDHDSMLVLVKAFLTDAGYRVLEAEGGARALEVCRRHEGAIDLLLTDVRMPKMDGPELCRRVAERHPGIKVLFMSGFAREWAEEEGVPEDAAMIEKGFTPQQLQRRVKAVLNGG